MNKNAQNMIISGGKGPKAICYYDIGANTVYYCDTQFCFNLKTEKVRRVQKVVYDTPTFDNVVEYTFARDPVYDPEWWSFNYTADSLSTVQALQYNLS